MKGVSCFFCVIGLLVSETSGISSALHRDGEISRGKRNAEGSSYFYYQQPEYPRDCKEVHDQCEGQSADGVYVIKPEGSPEPFEVYCNNSIDGGGWTIFQRRMDGSVDFYRYWNDYKNGFGFLGGELWLGNDKISYLTNQKNYEFRIDFNNLNGEPYFTKYNLFRISDEGSKYRLVGLGDIDTNSTANYNAISFNASFSTRDRDNDPWTADSCATFHHGGGWWYGYLDMDYCGHSRPNSLYNAGAANYQSIRWHRLPGGEHSITYTEMKIKPLTEP